MGGLLGTVVDRGGPYPARIRRMAAAGIFGGAAGLLLGEPGARPGLAHGRAAGPGGRDLGAADRGRGHRSPSPACSCSSTPSSAPARSALLRPWWWPPLLLLGRRGLGDGAAGARVADRAAGPGAAQHRRRLPRHRPHAARRRHAGVPGGPSGRRQRAQPGLGRPRRAPGPGQRPGSGADPHRRAAPPDPPAHRGGRHPGARGRPGPPGARRDDRRDRRRHRVRHAGHRGPAARRPDARPPALAAAVAGAADLVSGKRPAGGRGPAAPRHAAARPLSGTRSRRRWAAASPASSRSG